MAALDRVKEDIGYQKVWMGALLVVEVGLISWLVHNYRSAEMLLILSDILAIIVVAGAAVNLHFRLEKKIVSLEEL